MLCAGCVSQAATSFKKKKSEEKEKKFRQNFSRVVQVLGKKKKNKKNFTNVSERDDSIFQFPQLRSVLSVSIDLTA